MNDKISGYLELLSSTCHIAIATYFEKYKSLESIQDLQEEKFHTSTSMLFCPGDFPYPNAN